MERLEEYQALRQSLAQPPEALAQVTERALKRARKGRLLTAARTVAVSAVLLLGVFAALVNGFPQFAYACGRLPLLRELAQAVALSPSLSAAVENQYVQPIEQEQSSAGVTARIEYVIVDQKQVNVFYTLDSTAHERLTMYPEVAAADGSELAGYSISQIDGGEGEKRELRYFTLDFSEGSVPSSLAVTLQIMAREPERLTAGPAPDEHGLLAEQAPEKQGYLFAPTFVLSFDPGFTAQGQLINLNQAFTVDGQQLVLETVEIYPTHGRLNFAASPENTAWLKGWDGYLENERGQRFERVSNGLVATGSADSPMMDSYRMESSFFAESKSLTLHITHVTWLDKDKETLHLDLANTRADILPQGVSFTNAQRYGNSWILTFTARALAEHQAYQVWSSEYYGPDGEVYTMDAVSTRISSYFDQERQRTVDVPGQFSTELPLKHYPYDEVDLQPTFTRMVELPQEVVVEIK